MIELKSSWVLQPTLEREFALRESPRCVGCGFCCTEVMCRIGAMIYGHYTNPCPALTWKEDRYICSLYLADPLRYEYFLEIGAGCCFPFNPWRQKVVKKT